MDKSLNFDDPRVAAQALHSWLDTGECVGSIQFPSRLGLEKKLTINNQKILGALLEQPRMPAILNQWRPLFEQGKPLELPQAIRFLQLVQESLENAESLLEYRCIGNMNAIRRDDWNDIRTYRPGVKGGWGMHLSISGSGDYQCRHKTLTATRGDLVLMAPRAFYDFRRTAAADHWDVHWVVFQAESRWNELLNWPAFGGGFSSVHCADDAEIGRLDALFREIADLSDSDRPAVVSLRRNLVEQILLRCAALIPAEHRAVMDPRIGAAMRYIEAHVTEEFRVDEVAAAAHLSNSSLTRLFKAQTGLSVLAWRDEQRMLIACDQLANTLKPVAEVAARVGYTDQLYFSRIFRRRFGLPPSRYRKQMLSPDRE